MRQGFPNPPRRVLPMLSGVTSHLWFVECCVRRGTRLVSRNSPMLRCSFVLAGLVSVAIVSAMGCRACSSCHDYDSPVANCQCGASASPCGCSSCNGGGNGACSSGCNCGGEHSAPAYVPTSRPAQANQAPVNRAQQNAPPATEQMPNGTDQQ
jgi:hypothetical protein